MRMGWGILLMAACMGGPALAQEGAYRAGMRVATMRGYDNADCYARVFAKHAVVKRYDATLPTLRKRHVQAKAA